MTSLDLASLPSAYASHTVRPAQVMQEILDRIAATGDPALWISLRKRAEIVEDALRLESRDLSQLPLYGVPFAIKDNIDFAGLPTTAACPAYSYDPETHAHVVGRLIGAGAILIGKTNLDQFATGLVGTRSPYGTPRNPFNPDYIPGGSSSGSAVAVARGLASFALGTDTAGSGRVPAAFNNLIGLKPTRGLISCRGVAPACQSLDCVSIFALNAHDAARILSVATAFDEGDPYSRPAQAAPLDLNPDSIVAGVPMPHQLEFFGNASAAALYRDAVEQCRSITREVREVDISPFLDAARLLYDGPWVAERYCAIEEFLSEHTDAMHPVTRQIITGARSITASSTFKSMHRLAALRQAADLTWQSGVHCLVLPTTGTVYTTEAIAADPITLNSRLGHYTNFMNLLDLCGVAVPAGFLDSNMPWGVTLVSPAFCERMLLELANALHDTAGTGMGLSREPVPRRADAPEGGGQNRVRLVVCGAHMRGLPLNHQLTTLGARFLCETTTAPVYRFYALPGGPPHRPGLVRTNDGGAAISVEVWSLSPEAFGRLTSAISAPLGIGQVQLADGSSLTGFLCESCAVAGARDITGLGSWRNFLAHAVST